MNAAPAGSGGIARRHVRWAIPLLLGVIAFFGLGTAGSALVNQATREGSDPAGALWGLLLVVLAYVAALVALVFVIVGIVTTLVQWRRRRLRAKGRLTPAERAAEAQAQAHLSAWDDARALRETLVRHHVPPQVTVWDVVPNAGEVFFVDAIVHYARFYGQEVPYSRSGGYFFGHPLFVVAGIALTEAGNAARRSAAEAAARTQWRDQQPVRLLVSNQRLICNVGGQWLTFAYAAITAVYPEVDDWSLICQFDSTSPLMLHGPAAPAAALITVLMTHGPDAVQHHPAFQRMGGA